MTAHIFKESILREYDIRGIVGETLDGRDARALGRAFGTFVLRGGGRTVALGYDGRLSSPELAAALAEGLVSTGADVLRIGLGPTPMLYFASKHLQTDGAVMVTGSHNPANYNGFKMVSKGAAIYGGDIQRLGAIARAGDFASGRGKLADHDLRATYVARLLQDMETGRPLKVAWDAGNGAAGAVMADLTKALPGTHVLLNEAIDGRFPSHHPDPTVPENLEQLRAAVLREGCDLGIAFDGDGDRIGVLDGKGRILWGDQFLVFLAQDVLRRQPGATIIADVKASQVLFDAVARMGGKPLMWRTGHSLIKAKMAETGALLAGEMSGHIFFADRYYGYDDALYAAVRLLNVVSREDASLAEMRDRLPAVVNTPELRIPCGEARKFAAVEEVKARLAADKADVSGIDGVRVRTADGWWLLRASNTQDVLVARCEASSEAGLARLKAILAEQLKASGIAFSA
ncbi:MAG TPA: phosphomannomutase/phosphoglucomutase [Alphaproteobacteria bacterium]|nr:phosphomannomutase/phosphoglucomutase [Alphaproteobacteria bacterium]